MALGGLITLPALLPQLSLVHSHQTDNNNDAASQREELELQQMDREDEAYEHQLVRTSSPDRMEDAQDEITPATPPLGSHRRAAHSRASLEKPSVSSSPTSPTHTLPYSNSAQRPLGRLGGFVSRSWSERHNPTYQGFWWGVWHFVVGTKDPSFTPSNGSPDVADPDYIPPKYRWTPILSGLLQPFSILLEIPGLTEHWYVRTINNKPVVYQANPVILDVGLAISMACAIVANIALISRFLERRVLPCTIVTIVGLTVHDLINIVAVTIFGVVHRFDDGFTYSEAFWLCVCSTIASLVTNITLIYDLVRTRDFRRSGSGLTPKQRSLVIIVMILLVYIAAGALVFNFLLPDLAFQNCLYYTVVSIETIGFGDIVPSTLGAKIFLFFYVPPGILNLAVTVGTARDTIVESWNTAYRRRRHEVLKRHRVRKKQREEEAIRRQAIERQLARVGKAVYVDTRGGGVRGGSKGRKLNVRALTADQLGEAEKWADESIAAKVTGDGQGGEEQRRREEEEVGRMERERDELAAQTLLSEEGYLEFKERMAREDRVENLIKFASAFSLFLLFWIIGATVFCKTEKWSWFIAFYFCFVAFTTIGYGEVSPQTPAGRAFFIIWAIFGVATVTLLIAVLTEAYANRYKYVTKGALEEKTKGEAEQSLLRNQQEEQKRQVVEEMVKSLEDTGKRDGDAEYMRGYERALQDLLALARGNDTEADSGRQVAAAGPSDERSYSADTEKGDVVGERQVV